MRHPVYVTSGSVRRAGASSVALFVVLGLIAFVVSSYFLRCAYCDLRESFMIQLHKERQVSEANTVLKTELSAITQSRYLELKARERLGLKKAKDEEVFVVR